MAPRKQKEAPGTALATWDEQMARDAQLAADMEANAAGGQFFSLKGGVLSFNSNPFPNNEFAGIIVDSVLENIFYEGDYDSDDPQPPSCFAFGRADKDMAPHKVVVEAGNAQHATCAGCPNNEWGSADKGRGKACKNSRRVAILGAGTMHENGKFELFPNDYLSTAAIGFLRIPVTSVKGYASYVQKCAALVKRPPWAIVTKIKLVPDPATQIKLLFNELLLVPEATLATIHARVEEVRATIEFPYTPRTEEAAKPDRERGGRKVPNKGTAARKGGRR